MQQSETHRAQLSIGPVEFLLEALAEVAFVVRSHLQVANGGPFQPFDWRAQVFDHQCQRDPDNQAEQSAQHAVTRDVGRNEIIFDLRLVKFFEWEGVVQGIGPDRSNHSNRIIELQRDLLRRPLNGYRQYVGFDKVRALHFVVIQIGGYRVDGKQLVGLLTNRAAGHDFAIGNENALASRQRIDTVDQGVAGGIQKA